MTASRIYITNDRGYDLSEALDYTSLSRDKAFHCITSGKENIFDMERLVSLISSRVEGFSSEDYVLVCGSTLISSIVVAILARRLTHLNLLLFDSRSRSYIATTVDLP